MSDPTRPRGGPGRAFYLVVLLFVMVWAGIGAYQWWLHTPIDDQGTPRVELVQKAADDGWFLGGAPGARYDTFQILGMAPSDRPNVSIAQIYVRVSYTPMPQNRMMSGKSSAWGTVQVIRNTDPADPRKLLIDRESFSDVQIETNDLYMGNRKYRGY